MLWVGANETLLLPEAAAIYSSSSSSAGFLNMLPPGKVGDCDSMATLTSIKSVRPASFIVMLSS